MIDAVLDSNVLLAAFVVGHVHHESSRILLRSCTPDRQACAAHSLAEFYCNLTRWPGRPRVAPAEAKVLVASLSEHVSTVALDEAEYNAALDRWSDHGVVGAHIYDGLIASCALKAGARALYTWNVKHFARLGPDIAALARTP